MAEQPKVLIRTFGCRVNQYDSAKMLEGFRRAGIEPVDEELCQTPDVVVVNTCSVTSDSDKKARQLIRKLAREHPQAKLVVTGCYAELKGEQLIQIEGVDRHVLMNDQHELPALMAEELGIDSDAGMLFAYEAAHAPLTGFGGRTRAFIKVQEGCDLWCTYCSIPKSRGEPRSRTIDEVLIEAQSLLENNFGEIVLCGTRLGSYGRDLGLHITELLEPLARLNGLKRLRLSSFEPEDLDEALIDFIASTPVACPHLHLPLQAGSDAVLKRMGRLYRREEYAQRIEIARERIADFAVTTDIITGFPGETETDFEDSLDMIRRCRFAKVHSFPYSERDDTPAAAFTDQVERTVRRERRKRLDEIAFRTAAEFRKEFDGTTQEVLIETGNPDKGYAGFTGNYLRCEVNSCVELERGSLIPVVIKDSSSRVLVGEAVGEEKSLSV